MITRHNEIRDELADLASKAINPSAVRDEPKIYPCRPAKELKTSETKPVVKNFQKHQGEERGDLLIRSFWENGTDTIIDVRVTNLDANTYRNKAPMKALAEQEKQKKKKYLEACLEQRRHFTPFVVSTDGMIGKEGKALLKNLASRLAEKTGKDYSEVCGYVNARMSIAIVRATHLCLRGSRVPTSQMSNRRPQWEGDGAGLSLFRRN